MKKASFVTSTFMTAEVFLKEYIGALTTIADVYLFTNVDNETQTERREFLARIIPVPIKREISPSQDLVCLSRFYKLFKSMELESCHSVTPKAGFLSMVASY
ncbi:MAG: hypothetical protein N2513_10155, partial [Deltaproteobacteria bacterium]|nr:hypothetical protein [Deltaproteobacteria bacterium]